jgi:energy-coupling factor transport system ATP-binding protein
MEEAIRAERVIVLEQGRIALDGTPPQVFSDDARLAALHLSPPPAGQLAARLRRRLPALPPGLLTPDALSGALAPWICEAHGTEWRSGPAMAGATAAEAASLPGSCPSPDAPELHGRLQEGLRTDTGAERPLIEVRGLQHTYMLGTPLAHVALRGVDFALWPGELVGLIGATGSGKSTLLQHLNGLIRPQTGTVRVDAHNLGDSAVDMQAVRRKVGLVFQRPEDQLFERYVGDDVAYGPRLAGLDGLELRKRVRWAMDAVGLEFEATKDRLTFTLSGGERRKAALAGVLALRPQVLALDEPTSGLDPAARSELLKHLHNLRRGGQTLVVATHNMDDLAALSDRVYVLAEGKVVLHGPTRRVFAQGQRLLELGLGVPSPVQIAGALRDAGLPVPADPMTLPELDEALGQLLGTGVPAEISDEVPA